MHAIDLADLAGTYTRMSLAQLSLQAKPSRSAIQDYWLTSRYRHENWMCELSRHRDAIARPGTSYRTQKWHEILPVMQEILLAEPLTRCIAYQATAMEELQIDCDSASLAQNVLSSQIEARNRCLHLIVFGQGLSVEKAVQLNRLRRTLERYTDQLLSLMHPLRQIEQFCFAADEVRRAQPPAGSEGQLASWSSLQATLWATQLWKVTRHEVDWRSANARLNYRLSQMVLGMWTTAQFDSLGVPHSRRMARLRAPSPESTGNSCNLDQPLVYPLSVLSVIPREPQSIPQPRLRRLDDR